MATASARVTVQTTATRLDAPGQDNRDGTSVLIRPTGDIYIGGPDVTTGNGLFWPSGEPFGADLHGTDTLYGVAAAPTVVHVFRAGV